ncbi:hypothetical protein [Mycoplasmopsis felifaucium]|uniref:hypothetical protein n=1 Tax=Mycoplasmopsis felifaucium TaxID=35768 RepID=UPI00048306B4|nr:hypothetical protein [Mycoplasmopsis felifaucium]
MKLELIAPILSPVVVTTTSNIQENETEKFIFDYIQKNNIPLEKIDLGNLKQEYNKKFPERSKTIENIDLSFLKKSVNNHLKEIENEIKSSVEAKHSKREHNKYVKRIYTDLQNKYMVNQDGVESSKNILARIEETTAFYNEQSDNLNKYTEAIKQLSIASITMKTICGVASAISVSALIASFFTAGATSAVFGIAGKVAAISGFITATLDALLHFNRSKLKQTQLMIEFVKNIKNTVPVDIIKYFIKYAMDINADASKKLITKLQPKLIKLIKFMDIFSGIANIAENIDGIYNDVKYLEKINNDNIEASNKLANIANDIANMKKVKWTVLHETPLDNPYMLGGTGGINQIFKNIETGEVLRLDEMLKFTKFELYSMGLTKALHPKTGWYIRTLPNNLKIDNLG